MVTSENLQEKLRFTSPCREEETLQSSWQSILNTNDLVARAQNHVKVQKVDNKRSTMKKKIMQNVKRNLKNMKKNVKSMKKNENKNIRKNLKTAKNIKKT